MDLEFGYSLKEEERFYETINNSLERIEDNSYISEKGKILLCNNLDRKIVKYQKEKIMEYQKGKFEIISKTKIYYN